MANLKKHFVFKVGGAIGGSSSGSGSAGNHGISPSADLLPPGFSKSAFMNEVSCLLEQCGVYVSAMNGFCTNGCSLAKCLVKVFHAVPLYRETAVTLLSNWEEIAQTTAAASASVKTETLMQLQDVLTRLETTSDSREDELAESVHTVSSCLMAYIELQAQFSYSVFKALGKLSRQQQNGFFKTSRAEEAVRKQFSQIINRLTGPSASKTPSNPSTPQATTPQQSHTSSVWPAEIHLAPSGEELVPSDSICSAETPDSGLDDVINLLSIGAVALPPIRTASCPQVPPKVPPRPDAISQDAFRLKQIEASRAQNQTQPNKTHQEPAASWTPWSAEWSTEDLTNWPSHSSDASDFEWNRWQTTAKEKTSTWPRPLRDPTAPWEYHEDHVDDMLEAAANSREGERTSKTCTWPMKTDGTWSDDPWKKGEPNPSSSQASSPWGSETQNQPDQEFHLFNQR